MGNTSFIVLRSARDDVLAGPRTQFAELTGAYWLEPIYAGLANEWNRQGRTVPGGPREQWRVMPDGSRELDGPEGPEGCDEPITPLAPLSPVPDADESGESGPGSAGGLGSAGGSRAIGTRALPPGTDVPE